MCGIAGFIGKGTVDDLAAMSGALGHRGPDGEGSFAEAPVFLASRRLAVIDPAGGAQPMWDAAGQVCIVFNGEIYNHRALRGELERKGHVFRSGHSDTEVIVEGYKAWGTGVFERLNGMFAVALYDRAKRRLVMARDRFGEKPLFYAARPGAFAFASELGALLKHPSLRTAAASKTGLMKFFAHGFFPAGHTPYEGVQKLLAGHVMTVDTATMACETRAYWKFEIVPDVAPPGNVDDWAAELEHLLGRAVARRLESDVPLGIFLSGGVDSGAVLSFAADARPAGELRTFSVGFRDPSFDESGFAADVARHVGSVHKMEVCDLETASLPPLSEPLGDSSILPTHKLAAFARRDVTVALTGDGGDELFAGYDPLRMLRRAEIYDRFVPSAVHGVIAAVAARLPRSDANMSFDFVLNRGVKGLKKPPALRNPLWLAPLQPDEIADIFATPIGAEELYSEAIAAWNACPSPHAVDRSLDFYTRFYLTDGILVKTDRAAMLASLETRAPFLDNDLVDFVRRLPWQVKLAGNTTKWLLKRALRNRLPAHILARKKKGFGIPLSRLLRGWQPPLHGVAFVDAAKMRGRWRAHAEDRRDDRLALWCWLATSHGA